VRLVHTLRGSEAPPPACDCFITTVVSTLRRLTGADVIPIAVSLRRATPADRSAWRRALRIEPRYGQARNELLLSEALLSAPLRGADPGLAAVLRTHLDSMLAARPANGDLVDVVRDRIERGLECGVPDLERVAKALGLGPRNLQRQLHARGLRFQQLVDATRRDLALRRVADGDGSFAAIAVELGFSEVSAFYRAFRRWTGTTPAAHRARRRCVAEMPSRSAPAQDSAMMRAS
jgi:AraC-like DNA-binding protein